MRCMAANPSSRTRKQGCCCHGLRRFIQQGSAKDLFFKRTYAGGLHPPASCLLPPVCAAAPAGLHACVHEAFAKGSGACLQIRAPSYHPFDTLRPSPHTLTPPFSTFAFQLFWPYLPNLPPLLFCKPEHQPRPFAATPTGFAPRSNCAESSCCTGGSCKSASVNHTFQGYIAPPLLTSSWCQKKSI